MSHNQISISTEMIIGELHMTDIK